MLCCGSQRFACCTDTSWPAIALVAFTHCVQVVACTHVLQRCAKVVQVNVHIYWRQPSCLHVPMGSHSQPKYNWLPLS